MTVFIVAPVVAAFIWFSEYATPLFASEAEFVVQKSEGGQPQIGGMMGAAAGLAGGGGGQDAIMLQSFLTSRDALDMLEADHGFSRIFSDEKIDILKRLPPNAPREDVFDLYEKMVLVSYDPTEGLVHMEVLSPDPDISRAFALSLISYAEERIDSMTLRIREHQMAEAAMGYQQSEEALRIAQEKVIALQEAYSVLPPDAEAGVLSGRMGELEAQLVEARIRLTGMDRLQSPNRTQHQIAKDRVADLERELDRVRQDVIAPGSDGLSQAAIQGEIALAQGEVEARLAILAQSAQQMEMARLEASKQMRFLSVSVNPGMTDVAAYPEIWKNTGLTFLAIVGIYMAISLMGTVLREQVNS
jgi:capsular polysaccharide transport system permease protein